jgi:hypothetical protein
MSKEPEKREVAGIPVCEESAHKWVPVPTPHPSVTGQVYECSKCRHQRTVGP